MEGDRGRETGEKGAGEVGAGEEGARGLLQKVAAWWWEAGEKGGNDATLCNISLSKKCKEVGANKYRVGTGD